MTEILKMCAWKGHVLSEVVMEFLDGSSFWHQITKMSFDSQAVSPM